LPLN